MATERQIVCNGFMDCHVATLLAMTKDGRATIEMAECGYRLVDCHGTLCLAMTT